MNIYYRVVFHKQIKLGRTEEVNIPSIFNNVTYLPRRKIAKENVEHEKYVPCLTQV